MPHTKFGSFDVVITQRGDIYTVSGADAAALHAKMQSLPEEAKSLLVSEFKDGVFTMQKMLIIAEEAPKVAVNG